MNGTFSIYTTYLTMESLDIHPSNILPAFIIGTLTYCTILFLNTIVLLTIVLNRKLHKPMYILLFNLPLNDMLGASAFFPPLVSSIPSQNRSITYPACFGQALLSHVYGAGAFLILSAMAYDRYIAICRPLKYNTLMSPNNLMKIIITVWTLDIILIGVLLALSYRQEICSTKIVDIFCNKPSLMKLICGDITLTNYYGLFITALFPGLSLLILVFTYIQILIAVVVKRQSDAKSKAIQTCGTHLIVFLSYEFTVCFATIAHISQTASPSLRKALGASVMIFPPILNILIYGLKTKEIQQNLVFFFHKDFSPTQQKNKLNRVNKRTCSKK